MPSIAEASLLIVLTARDEAKAVLKESEGGIASLGKAAATAAVAVGAAVAAGIGASIDMASHFQQSLTMIHTQAGATDEDLNRISDSILKMAPQVGQGPQELIDAMYHLESAGFRGATAIDALRSSAQLATIGHANLEATTQAVVGVLAAYPSYMGNAAQAAAQLNAIVGTGDMRMDGLAKAMATGILPAAANVKLGLTDVGAALATLTDNVTPPDEAATRLRMTFALLEHQSNPAAKALASIGIASGQLGQDMVKPNGLLVAVTDLKTHLAATFGPEATDDVNHYLSIMKDKGVDAANQYASAAGGAAKVVQEAFGGGRTSAAIETLLGEYDRFKGKYAAITDGAHNWQQDWAETTKNFSFSMASVHAALDSLGIRVGQFFLPIATQVAAWMGHEIPIAAQAVGDWFNRNKATIEDVGNTLKTILIVAFQVLKQAISDALAVIGFLSDHLTALAIVVGPIVAAFIAWKTAMLIEAIISGVAEGIAILQGVMALATIQTFSLSAATGLLTAVMDANPIMMVVLAIIALIAIVILVITHFQRFKDILGAVGNFLKTVFLDAVNAVVGFFTALPGRLGTAMSAVGSALKTAATTVLNVFVTVLKALPQAIVDILIGIPLLFTMGVVWIIEQVVKGAVSLVKAFVDWGPQIVGAITGFLAGLPGMVWGFLVMVVQKWLDLEAALLAWAARAIPNLLSTIVGFFVALPGNIASKLSALAGALGGVFSSALTWLGKSLDSWAGSIVSWFTSLPQNIVNWVSGALGALGSLGSQIVGAIAKGITSAPGALVSAVKGVINSIPGVGGLAKAIGLAEGGIVKARTGGTVVTVAEAGEDEWVVPASKMRALVIGAGMGASGVTSLPTGGMAAPSSRSGGQVVIQLMVDRRMLGQIVMDEFSKLHRLQSPRLAGGTG